MAKAKTDIRSLARSHTKSAINCLVGIMNQKEAPAAARVAAAQAVLDRGWGKPAQAVALTDTEGNSLTWTDLIGRTLTNGDRSASTEGADESGLVH